MNNGLQVLAHVEWISSKRVSVNTQISSF